jgi:hypothetical protein
MISRLDMAVDPMQVANHQEGVHSMIVHFDSQYGPVYVEVAGEGVATPSPRRGEQPAAERPAAASHDVIEKAQQTFESALASAKPGIDAALDVLANLVKAPAETEIEFGLKIDAKAGAVFASAGAETTFKVKLTWKKD